MTWGRISLVVCVVLLAVAPFALSPFRLDLLAKYLCYAIVAVGIALAWGRGGMLTLGQGVFFGLGGYAMGMHLKLAEAGPGRPWVSSAQSYPETGRTESVPCRPASAEPRCWQSH